LQKQGKWYQEGKPKRHPKPEAKKNNNYSTHFVGWIYYDLLMDFVEWIF